MDSTDGFESNNNDTPLHEENCNVVDDGLPAHGAKTLERITGMKTSESTGDRCRTEGCEFFGNIDWDGHCSSCWWKPMRITKCRPISRIDLILQDEDIKNRLCKVTAEEEVNREENSSAMELGAWSRIRAVDVSGYHTVQDFEAAIDESKVQLNQLVVTNIDLEDAAVNNVTAIVTWKWDITNRIDPAVYMTQRSINIAIAIRKAIAVGIRYLIVDAISLDQFAQLNAQLLKEYVSLYSKLRVISTWCWENCRVVECTPDPYPVRAWLLFESSKYLLNERVTLSDLLNVPAEVKLNDSDYQVAVCFFLRTISIPLCTVEGRREPAFFHPELMPRVCQEHSPIINVFRRAYGGDFDEDAKQCSYIHKICDYLRRDKIREIVTGIDDIILMNIGTLYSEATAHCILALADTYWSVRNKQLLFFIALHLFCLRKKTYYAFAVDDTLYRHDQASYSHVKIVELLIDAGSECVDLINKVSVTGEYIDRIGDSTMKRHFGYRFELFGGNPKWTITDTSDVAKVEKSGDFSEDDVLRLLIDISAVA